MKWRDVMKLIHLSDLHIGKKVNEFSMLEDQQYIFEKIRASPITGYSYISSQSSYLHYDIHGNVQSISPTSHTAP